MDNPKWKSKYICLSVAFILCAVFALWIFVDHICGWKPQPWALTPQTTVYCGVNVVSPWADFAFFTYQTLIFFGVWCVLSGVALIFKASGVKAADRLVAFAFYKYVKSFVLSGYAITCVVYTAFELIWASDSFGLYDARVAAAWHNFGTNLAVHYALFAACVALYFVSPTCGKRIALPYVIVAAYAVTYVVAVKLTGAYCYSIEWYPYPIFHTSTIMQVVGIENRAVATCLLVVVFVAIGALYGLVFGVIAELVSKVTTKQSVQDGGNLSEA